MFKQKKPILFKVTVTNGVCLLLQDLLQKLFGGGVIFLAVRAELHAS